MSSGLIRLAVASFLGLAGVLVSQTSFAQEAQPAAPATQPPAAQTPAAQTPATPAPAPAVPESQKPAEQAQPQGGGDASTGETVDLPARPFAYVEGKAGKDDIYAAILASLAIVRGDMDKAGLKPAGRPLAVFVSSDDSGFTYHAGYPLASAPDAKTSLGDAVKIGETPGGKAMRFEHDGAYNDIDATYDAITAYLDDKGIEAQDAFIEEYLNDVKDPDDPSLRVNIYVLMK